MMASAPPTIVCEIVTVQAVVEFLAECEARDLRPKTLAFYGWVLGKLRIVCRTLPPTRQQLLQVLTDKRLGPESRKDLRRGLNCFFGWCLRVHSVPNLLDELPAPPNRKTLPRVLTVDELRVVIGACVDAREWAIIALVMDTGLRLGEIASLTKRDLGTGHLRVRGKVGDRQVPVSTPVRELLLALGDGNHIWIGKQGPLTIHGVRMLFVRLLKRSGLTGAKLGPHVLRHTFGTFYVRAGGSVSVLQLILGHEELSTTMIYVHLAGSDVAADHAQHSPIRSLGLL